MVRKAKVKTQVKAWNPSGRTTAEADAGEIRTGPAVMTSCSLWPVSQYWCPQLPSQCLTGKGHAWAWKVRDPPPSIPYSWILAQFQSLFSWPYMGKQRTKLEIGCELSDTGCASQKCSRFSENTLICFQQTTSVEQDLFLKEGAHLGKHHHR